MTERKKENEMDEYTQKQKRIFSKNIKKLRNDLKETQFEFGHRIGLTQQMINFYENDSSKHFPTVIKLLKMCDKLNVSLDWIFDRNVEILDCEEERLLNDFRVLNEDGKARITEEMDNAVSKTKYRKKDTITSEL